MATTTTKYKVITFRNKEDYNTLKTTGTVTVDGVTYTYSPSDTIYCVPDETVTQDELDEALEDKVDIEQGATNANKLIATDSNGDIKTFTDIPTLTGRQPLALSSTRTDPSTLNNGVYDVTTGGVIGIGNSIQKKFTIPTGAVLYKFDDFLGVTTDDGGRVWVDFTDANANWLYAGYITKADMLEYLAEYQPKNRYITNTSVALADWEEEQSPTYADYPYVATIPIQGVTVDTYVYIIWDNSDSNTAKLYANGETVAGGINIYAEEPVAITIPTIKVEG